MEFEGLHEFFPVGKRIWWNWLTEVTGKVFGMQIRSGPSGAGAGARITGAEMTQSGGPQI